MYGPILGLVEKGQFLCPSLKHLSSLSLHVLGRMCCTRVRINAYLGLVFLPDYFTAFTSVLVSNRSVNATTTSWKWKWKEKNTWFRIHYFKSIWLFATKKVFLVTDLFKVYQPFGPIIPLVICYALCCVIIIELNSIQLQLRRDCSSAFKLSCSRYANTRCRMP